MPSKPQEPWLRSTKIQHKRSSCEDYHMLYTVEVIWLAMTTARTVEQAVAVVAKKTMSRLILKEAMLPEVALVD